MNVNDIREEFIRLKDIGQFVVDKTGVPVLEIMNASFVADESAIFGRPNDDYIRREINWYKKMSLNVNDIEEPIPEIWKAVASPDGRINSNYGWCIWHYDNYFQYSNVYRELSKNPYSRRATMIYTRPSMWYDYVEDGMSDFMCTNAVTYLFRNGRLHAFVQMRSNDAVYGYKNDVAWQKYVLKCLAEDLNIDVGNVHWNATSLHVYQRHFDLVK
jgi:thymidylate synthase